MTGIKFCGLRREEDVEAANSLHPDFVGFVFYKPSRRYVTPEKAVELADKVAEDIQIVGVFLDEPLERVIEIAETGCIDVIQLHGSESERYVRMARNMTGLPIIRAFTVKSKEDVDKAVNTEADYLMLDAGAGTGKSFDWSLLEDVGREYFLAGGLDAGNVADAISRLHPMVVDTSSGIETDGLKDPEKMRKFKEAVDRAA